MAGSGMTDSSQRDPPALESGLDGSGGGDRVSSWRASMQGVLASMKATGWEVMDVGAV